MKIKTLLISGSFLTFLLFVIIGVSGYTQSGKVIKITDEIAKAGQIAQAASDFNIGNFHTQLAVLEYAYDPKKEKLDAFEAQNAKLTVLLEKFVEMIDREVDRSGEYETLYENAERDTQKIIKGLELVREDWKELIVVIGEYEKARDAGETDELLHELDDAALIKINANEKLFNDLEFNESVDAVVIAQEALIEKLNGEKISTISNYNNLMGILTFLATVISFSVSFYISHSIAKSLGKLSKTVDSVSKGNLNVTIEKGKFYEVNILAEALDRIMTTLKRAVQRVQQSNND